MKKICYPPSLDPSPFFGDNFTLGVSKTLSVSDSSRMCGPAAIFHISVWMLVHCTLHLAANSGACCRELHPELQKELKEFRNHLLESATELAPLKVWQLQGMCFGEKKSFCRTTMESIKTERSLRQGEYAN